jgi:hypothetical protein
MHSWLLGGEKVRNNGQCPPMGDVQTEQRAEEERRQEEGAFVTVSLLSVRFFFLLF